MDDEMIVALYWERNESAIRETEIKYDRYLTKIAYNTLADMEDSKESVNDTYLKAWNSMPEHRPSVLSTYLGKITRQAAIDIYRKRNSQKRYGSEYALSLTELTECVPVADSPEKEWELYELGRTINAYLRTISQAACRVFVSRYYFMDSIREISLCFGMSESKVKSMLYRTRLGLKVHLEQEGFSL